MTDITTREPQVVDMRTVPLPRLTPESVRWNDVVGRSPFRPAPPTHGFGRRLRSIIGIDEEILDAVPEERARYSGMGAIVLFTGTMALLSGSAFLSRVDAPFILLFPFAVFWGLLIFTFDSWLVASTHGLIGAAKLTVFIPRLLISILMGAVIAEPMLLFLFGPAVQTEARDERMATISQYESHLKDCNPLTGEAPTVAGCEGEFLLNVDGSPQALVKQKAVVQARRDEQQKRVTDINAELAHREELARTECNGIKTPDTTGVVGVGVNCRRNRAEADNYRSTDNLAAEQATLAELNKQIDDLDRQLGTVGSAYSAALTQRIADQVKAKRDNQSAVGILDEHAALEQLTQRSPFVFSLSWLVRLLLIVIDCLPVLSKLLSKATTYDSMLRRQLDMNDRIHERRTTERERRDLGWLDVSIGRGEQLVRRELESLDVATREARSHRETNLDDQIEELAAKLRGAGGSAEGEQLR